MKPIFDKTTDALAASLNFRGQKHNVTASNIANAETPGYHAKTVDFEEALSRALNAENPTSAIARTKTSIYDNPDAAVTNDGNSVNLENEMAALQENTILYKAALQLMNKKLGAMKYAAGDGGR